MSSVAPGSLVMFVVGDPIGQGPYLGTFEDQRILIGCKVLAQIFEAAMRLKPRHWQSCWLGLGMGFGIGLVAFGVVKG